MCEREESQGSQQNTKFHEDELEIGQGNGLRASKRPYKTSVEIVSGRDENTCEI
jgi:hypothetical protein